MQNKVVISLVTISLDPELPDEHSLKNCEHFLCIESLRPFIQSVDCKYSYNIIIILDII